MAQEIINYGNTANDGTGDPLRDAFIKVDDNFTQIWAAGPVGSNITIQNNTVAVVNTNGNLILTPNGVGVIQTNSKLVPRLDNTYDLGSSSLRYRSMFLGAGGLAIDGNLTLSNIGNLRIPGGENGYIIQTDGAGNLSWVALPGAGNGSPGGANTQVQFNDNGLFGGVNNFSFDKATSNLIVGNATVGNIQTREMYTSSIVADQTLFGNSLNINRTGAPWLINGNIITAPTGATWVSNVATGDEYFNSADDGYLNFQTFDSASNLASQIHLEHGLAHINIVDGGNLLWQFDSTGLFSAPGNITANGNIAGNYFLGDGSQLTNLPGGVIQGAIPPASPNDTTLWWDDITGRLYVWYDDGSGLQWVDAAPAAPAVTYGNANVALYAASGQIGNIISGGNAIYSLGNATNQWNDLYVTNVTASANISAGYFVGDGSLLTNIGAPNKIYNGTSYANIDSLGGNLEININNNSWVFDSTGNLTVPLNTNFNTPNVPYADVNFHVAQGGVVRITGGSGGLGPLLVLESDQTNSLNRIEIDTYGNTGLLGGTFLGSFSRGEPGSYQAVQAGDRLAGLRGSGYNGSSFITTGLVSIDAFDNWAVGNTPTKLSFWNNGYNGSQPILNMEINQDGNVNIFNGNIRVTGGGGYLQGNSTTGSGGLYAGIPDFTPLGSEVVAQFAANINSYSQLNFQNISNGAHSSTDAVLTADNGTDSTNFINLGITGSAWDGTQPNSLGSKIGPNDGYLYVQDGNLNLGTSVTAGGTEVWAFNNTGNLVLPTGGNVVGATANNNGYLSWVGNSSGDGAGYTTMKLIPDDTRESSDQYIILDPTAPGHIHIRAGGTQDDSGADLILGGENSYVKVTGGLNPPIYVSANNYSWTFGVDGVFQAPGDISTSGNVLAGNITAGTFVTTPVPLANLTAVAGSRAFVSDANLVAAGNFGALVGNAGSNITPVWSDGSNWYIG